MVIYHILLTRWPEMTSYERKFFNNGKRHLLSKIENALYTEKNFNSKWLSISQVSIVYEK